MYIAMTTNEDAQSFYIYSILILIKSIQYLSLRCVTRVAWGSRGRRAICFHWQVSLGRPWEAAVVVVVVVVVNDH